MARLSSKLLKNTFIERKYPLTSTIKNGIFQPFKKVVGIIMHSDFLQDEKLAQLEKDAFQAIQRIFPCEENLLDSIPLEQIINHYKKDILPSEKPFLIRVAGQSGSGKSSQIVPALQHSLKQKQYIKINVGAFAPFHPNYKEIQEKTPNQMREKTNGFALKALVMFYKHCILNKVNLVLDMTLLEPEIDLYLMALAKKMEYKIQMHLLCVPKKVSNHFIYLRQKQTGRYVSPKSSDYFFDALAPCLKALTHSHLFDNQDTLILWTYFLSNPIKITHLNNSYACRILEKYRGINVGTKNQNELLKAKREWMSLLLRRLET